MRRPRSIFVSFAAAVAIAAAGCEETPGAALRLPDEARAAQAAGPARAPAVVVPPRIAFASKTYDFGRISETETPTAIFSFTNTGGATLAIADVKTTCGCTVPTLERRRFEPGESGEIKVVYDPTGPGSTKRYLNVISNAEPDAVAVLTIKAEVEAFVILEPKKLDLGRLAFRSAHEASVAVSSSDPEFVINFVDTSNPTVTARVAGLVEDGAGASEGRRRERIVVRIAEDAPWGGLFSWLNVNVTGRPEPGGSPTTYMARLRVQGQVFGELTAEPDAFRYGVAPDEPFERRIELVRTSGEAFTVREARIGNANLAGARVRTERLGAGSWALVLTASGAARPQSGRGTVVVVTDVPGEERLDIPIIGVTRAPGDTVIRSGR